MSPSLRDIALLLTLSLMWAAGDLFISAADHGIPPLTATAAMSVVAAAILLPTVALWGRPLRPTLTRRPWAPVVMGLTAVALPNLAIVAAERSVEPDETAVLGATVPILTLLLTTFVTRETPASARRLAGVVTALVGLVVFVGWSRLTDGGAEAKGVLILTLGAACFAVNGVFAARQTEDLDGAALGAWTMVFAAPLLWAAAFVREDPLSVRPSGEAMAGLVANGIVSLAGAYLVYYLLVERAGALFTSLYAFLVPPLGVLLVALTTRQWPSMHHLVGVAIVLVGLFLLQPKDP